MSKAARAPEPAATRPLPPPTRGLAQARRDIGAPDEMLSLPGWKSEGLGLVHRRSPA